MNRKQSRKKICCLFVAVSILVALATSGCVTTRHHIGHGEHRVTRGVHPASVVGIAVGLVALGTAAWLYSRSESDKAKEQAANETAPQTSGPNGY